VVNSAVHKSETKWKKDPVRSFMRERSAVDLNVEDDARKLGRVTVNVSQTRFTG
jgi:hypothetical protein